MTALRSVLHGRLPRVRIGIAATLSVAFLAVAVLATAANLISERGLDVISAPHVVPTPVKVVTLPQPEVQQTPVVEPPTADPNEFLAARERYDELIQRRLVSDAAELDQLLKKSSLSLVNAHGELLEHVDAGSDPQQTKKSRLALSEYVAANSELVKLGDEARGLVSDYAARYEMLRARTRDSIDRAWKVFGRVVARQSIIALNRHIEELGRHSVAAGDNHSTVDFAAIAATEQAINALLTEQERGLSKSQGQEWLSGTRDDVTWLANARTALLGIHARSQALEDRIAQLVPRLQPEFARAVAVAAPTVSSTVEATAPIPAVEAMPNFAPMEVPVQVVASPQAVPVKDERSAIIAWISAGVLLLLVVISAATVRSVVGPVQRLVQATARLAEGEMHARVRPGGIKELDTLALAFNSMAERLAQAERIKLEYQQQLEARVEERTQQLQHLASNDPLTSLPNHRQLFVLLNQALSDAVGNHVMVGVYFLDIDNFKNINDGMGHAFGDQVLKAMAQRLEGVAKEFGFAARLGGDEFTVVIERATDLEEIREAGARLVAAFDEPLKVDNRDLALSVSVGASVFPVHEHTAEGLLRAADAALFRAKALGRSQLSMYSPELLEAASAKFAIEQGLRVALEKGEFELVFQPEISVDSLHVELVEALIRWRRPDGRLASPGEFLAVAEESGLIMDISDWVLRRAVETAARWHHGAWPRARVAINVSSRQLIDSHFVEHVKALLLEHQLPPRCIEIELTETVLQTGPATLEALRQLHAHGIAIALDDFGTGYSSLASLQQLPLTRIKLDRSLVNDIDVSARSLSITRSIIALARSLGLGVTAEGIERPAQLALLLREGSLTLQGFLFSRPIAEGDLIASLPNVESHSRHLVSPEMHQLRAIGPTSGEHHGVAQIQRLTHKPQSASLRIV